MKAIVERGLAEEREAFAKREDNDTHDLEIGIEFWLRVEECEHCGRAGGEEDGGLCSAHYERYYNTM
jgi:hypothetical protein